MIEHYKFNTFIAMFLIIKQVFSDLYRTYVKNIILLLEG